MGGKIRFFVSGGAPLSQAVAEFFFACGVLIIEGYGLTETSPVITANRPSQFKFGTVGLPLPGAELKIAGDGEILTRGPQIMKGYYQNPAATAEVIDAQGWFHTGDIGNIDSDGFLAITDRKKDLIKTSGGKMVAPQFLEAKLRESDDIDDAVIIGDKRKYLSALLVPNPEKLAALARAYGLSGDGPAAWVADPKIHDFFQKQLQTINQGLAQFEQIKRFALLPQPFSAGELTPTLKIKRRIVAERYAREIEALYPA
jgi:long-chain acyl-CoA synthetase